MKKQRIYHVFVCVVAFIAALIMTSCSLIDDDGKYGFDDEKKEKEVLSDISEYSLVKGDMCSDEEKEALVTLNNAISKTLGLELIVTTDWVGKLQQEREKEILIGETNREESAEAIKDLGENDYVIKKSGTKLIIAGGSGRATQAAVNYFIENYIDIYQATLSYPSGDGYIWVGSYMVDSITVDGNPLSEYKLYAKGSDIDLSVVQTAFSESISGTYLEIADAVNDYERYIIFDNTGLITSHYGVELGTDSNIYVYGSYDNFDEALEYFCVDFFEELVTKKGKQIDIKSHDNIVKYSPQKEIYSKDSLISLLSDVYNDKNSVIAGEKINGSQSMPSYTLQNYYNATGKYPAMIGIDLSYYGLHLTEMSDEDRSRAVCELVDYASKGGIITVMAQYENPTGNWTLNNRSGGTLGGDEYWEELLTEGTALNLKFKYELSVHAIFLDALKDNNVPVLFMPLNESNSDHFWYSACGEDSTVGAKYLKRLWVYIYDFYASFELDNLIWVYSPLASDGENGALDVMYAYPGDEYVDIVGTSWITEGDQEIDGSRKPYSTLTNSAKKIGALCEFSIKSGSDLICATKEEQINKFNSLDILDVLYDLRSKGYSFAYILTENGTSSVSWLGKGDEFVLDDMILTLEDIAPKLIVK